MPSPRKGVRTCRLALLGLAGVLSVVASGAALAHGDDWRWRHHGHPYHPRAYVYVAPRAIYVPPPVYYVPPPPPVYYVPPPRYVAPPSVGLFFRF